MTDDQRELAAMYAFGLLPADEAKAFEVAMSNDLELRAEVDALTETVQELGHLTPAAAPPPGVKARVMAEIKASATAPNNVTPFPMTSSSSKPSARAGFSLAGWGLAATFAISGAWLWNDRQKIQDEREKLRQEVLVSADREKAINLLLSKLEQQGSALQSEIERSKAQIATLNSEVEQWKKKDAFSSMQIATLQSTVDEYKQGVAVVIWDAEKQEGVLKLEKMPPVAPNKDYQLWVVDPKKKDPVDAGVVRVDPQGFARIDFKPIDIISEAAKFALSVEREGGVPKGEGPIVLIGP